MINLILSEAVIADVDESDKAVLFLFGGLAGILIVIMGILVAILTCKTRRLDK